MEQLGQNLMAESAAAAQQILTSRFQGAVRLAHGQSFKASGRSTLFRFHVVGGPSAAPRSIIAKRANPGNGERFDSRSSQGCSVRLFNEWAGLAFLNALSGDHALVPRWYGGNQELGLVVMEDLGNDCKRLDQILLGHDQTAAEKALLQMSEVLGTMHGLTANRQAEYEDLRSALGPRPESESPEDTCARFKLTLRKLTDYFGMPLTQGVLSDIDVLESSFRQGHPYWTYSHKDPCPDNWLFSGSSIRLIDFEYGGFGNAMLDGVYGRIHFPTCWCTARIPENIIVAMEHVYRNELSKRIPEALDDELYSRTFLEACAVHTLDTLEQYMTRRDRLWGVSTMQQRATLRTAVFFEMTEKQGRLESLGHLCRMLGARLAGLNEGHRSVHMPFYPAFRGHSASSRA